MVSRKEDKVDFNKLEIELANAVEADQRYWRENDAKLRAVQQKVATYDEFRCISCRFYTTSYHYAPHRRRLEAMGAVTPTAKKLCGRCSQIAPRKFCYANF